MDLRDSFIIYTENSEQLDMLNDEQAGILFKAIMHYQMEKPLPEMDGMTSIVFSVIRQKLDRDTAKYAEVCEKRKKAGDKGGRPTEPNGFSEEAKKPNGFSEKAKKPNGFSENQMPPDNDNDNEPDNDNDSKEKCKREKRHAPFTPPTLEEVREYCQERGNHVDAERFVDFYSAKSWMIGKNRMTDWKAAVRTWERDGKTQKPNGFQYEGRQRSPDEYSSLEAQLLGKSSEYAQGGEV